MHFTLDKVKGLDEEQITAKRKDANCWGPSSSYPERPCGTRRARMPASDCLAEIPNLLGRKFGDLGR